MLIYNDVYIILLIDMLSQGLLNVLKITKIYQGCSQHPRYVWEGELANCSGKMAQFPPYWRSFPYSWSNPVYIEDIISNRFPKVTFKNQKKYIYPALLAGDSYQSSMFTGSGRRLSKR